jgi:hypothetical protein
MKLFKGAVEKDSEMARRLCVILLITKMEPYKLGKFCREKGNEMAFMVKIVISI